MIAPPLRRLTTSIFWLGAALPAWAAEPICLGSAEPAAAQLPLRLAAAPRPLGETLDWSGQRFSSNERGETELSGDVQVRFGDREIRSDRLVYDPISNSLRIEGSVRYLDPSISVEGDAGRYGDDGAQFSAARFEMLQQPGRGSASRIELRPGGVVELTDVRYTTCPKDATDWELRAGRITLDTERQRGQGRDTRVIFKGVPILYLPWISFPLTDARQTGFLFPMIGSSSRNGVTLSVPWYWNIAPNRDLTLQPTYYERRGVDLGTEFRWLQTEGAGLLRLNYLPGDRVTDEDRSYQQLALGYRLPRDWRLQIVAENASDAHYFEDFTQGTQASSTTFLPRHLSLGYRSDVWRLRGEVLDYQTLIDCSTLPPGECPLPEADRPYTQLPRLSARGRWDGITGWRALLDTEVVGFQHSTAVQGWRGNVTPTFSWSLQRPGYFLRPSLAWDMTAYQLEAPVAGSTDRSPTREVPIVNIDSGLALERSLSGGRRALTLEPRLLYVYIPYRDQSGLPVFDTGVPDPNFISLFRANRYVGGDRIGDDNKLAIGITSRMYDGATGRQYLSATLGQRLLLDTPRVSLPNEALDTRRRSDLIANVELRAYHNLSLRLDAAWDPDMSRTNKTQFGISYQLAGNQVVNLGYRFDRGIAEQIDSSLAWPFGRRWEVYARSVYSLADDKPLDNFAGLRFRGACWGMRAVVRRSVSSRTGASDTGIYLQLELTGLSSVGTGADTFLQDSIQGYSAASSSR